MIRRHLAEYVGESPEALVFTGPTRCPAAPEQLRQARRLVGGGRGDRRAGSALPRSAAHRQRVRGQGPGNDDPRPDVTDGARLDPGRADLSTRLSRCGPDHRRRAPGRAGRRPGLTASGHVRGTRQREGGEEKGAYQSGIAVDLREEKRAGDGNRTRMASLEEGSPQGWGVLVVLAELPPAAPSNPSRSAPCRTRVAREDHDGPSSPGRCLPVRSSPSAAPLLSISRVSGVVWLVVVVIAPLAAPGHHPLPTQIVAFAGLDD
jgi:hypothetical protein